MQWLSRGLLPPTTENALVLNQAYQESLQQYLQKIDNSITALHAEQVK